MTSKEMAKVAYNALNEKKAIDITIIDISNISVVADYFIIAGGNNENQVKAMADEVDEKFAKHDINSNHVEGYQNANWILMDYGDIVVHVFNQDDRLFYDLEKIWRDGKVVNVEEL